MPLPQYFEELYNEFEELKRFDLQEVIYDRKMTELFMEEVREQIERKESLSPLKKKQIWSAVKESRFPIVLGAMCVLEGTIEFACNSLPLFWINVFRVATFTQMTKEGIVRGQGLVRRDNVEEQYQEVADEI
jgi:hypothetical protein